MAANLEAMCGSLIGNEEASTWPDDLNDLLASAFRAAVVLGVTDGDDVVVVVVVDEDDNVEVELVVDTVADEVDCCVLGFGLSSGCFGLPADSSFFVTLVFSCAGGLGAGGGRVIIRTRNFFSSI